MSLYTAVEIIVFLVLAWGLGAALGWVLRGRPDEAEAEVTLDPILSAQLSDQQAAFSRLRDDFDSREDMHLRLAVVNEARQKLQEQLAEVQAQARASQAQAQAMADGATDAAAARDRLSLRLASVESERVALARNSGRLESNRKRLDEVQRELRTASEARDARGREIERLHGVVSERDRTIAELQVELTQVQSRPPAPISASDEQVVAQSARIEALEAALIDAKRSAQPSTLSEALGVAEARTAELETQVLVAERARRSDVARAQRAVKESVAKVEAQAARIRDLEACVDGLAKDSEDAISGLRGERDALSVANERLAHERQELQRTLQALRAQESEDTEADERQFADDAQLPIEQARVVLEISERTAAGAPPANDNLEAIYGIGPKIAGLLRNMRITSFRQIAQLTPADIEIVGEALSTFPDRIRRDDWLGGARAAFREKYGQDLYTATEPSRAEVLDRLAKNATRASVTTGQPGPISESPINAPS